jgi:hypothetical protein
MPQLNPKVVSYGEGLDPAAAFPIAEPQFPALPLGLVIRSAAVPGTVSIGSRAMAFLCLAHASNIDNKHAAHGGDGMDGRGSAGQPGVWLARTGAERTEAPAR